MEQLVIADLSMPCGDGEQLLKLRKAIGVGQVELADAAGVSQQLVSFIETETQAFTESAKSKLWPAILRLGLERAKKNGSLEKWASMLVALSEAEEKKRAERNEQWEKIQAEQEKRRQSSIFGFLLWPTEEMKRIIAEGQAGVELSKLIYEQAKELRTMPLPHEKKAALAFIRKNPEKVLQEFRELFDSREEVIGWYERVKKEVETEMAARDGRIAELEQELRALKEAKWEID